MEMRRNVVCCLVVLAFVVTGTANAVLVGHWKLDDGTGQVAADSSGNGYDGQLGDTIGVDNTDPIWETGSARFDGTYFDKKYVNLDAYVSTFSALSQGTVAAWFKKDTMAGSPEPKPEHVNNNQVIFSISDNTAGSVELVLYT